MALLATNLRSLSPGGGTSDLRSPSPMKVSGPETSSSSSSSSLNSSVNNDNNNNNNNTPVKTMTRSSSTRSPSPMSSSDVRNKGNNHNATPPRVGGGGTSIASGGSGRKSLVANKLVSIRNRINTSRKRGSSTGGGDASGTSSSAAAAAAGAKPVASNNVGGAGVVGSSSSVLSSNNPVGGRVLPPSPASRMPSPGGTNASRSHPPPTNDNAKETIRGIMTSSTPPTRGGSPFSSPVTEPGSGSVGVGGGRGGRRSFGSPASSPTGATTTLPSFRFVSDDGFTRRVLSFDGQSITCTDSNVPTYEVGNYLGGGVAGVVYEGRRLRPANEYPPVRMGMGGHGAFAASRRGGGGGGGGGGGKRSSMSQQQQQHHRPPPSRNVQSPPFPNINPPVAMTMTTSSTSSVRVRSTGAWVGGPYAASSASGGGNVGDAEGGIFDDVYRIVAPKGRLSRSAVAVSSSPRVDATTGFGGGGRRSPSLGGGLCGSFLFGNCAADNDLVDDRVVPMSTDHAQRGVGRGGEGGGIDVASSSGKGRYQAVDVSSIEVPAAFSSMDRSDNANFPSGAGIGRGTGFVVVDDADAPNRSKREARALSRNAPLVPKEDGLVEDDRDVDVEYGPLIENVSETVAIKVLNPVGFRLLEPDLLRKALIVREGSVPAVEPDGSFVLKEEHVWWLVNPNSRNLRSLLRRSRSGASSMQSTKVGDDASDETSVKKQPSFQSSSKGGVDRGTSEMGLRLSLVATYVDPKTKLLCELPLPRCVEIWGHPPFAATDEEFEAMMEVLMRLNAGVSAGLKRSASSGSYTRGSPRGVDARSYSQSSTNMYNDPLASRRLSSTVFCPALSAYIAVPAVPPKYLRWLKQRRLATKEVRNMMRIGRHSNVVHLYEVLEMVQDNKSTMFLILELVRGGELFDLISTNSSSKRKNDRGGNGGGGGNEVHEVTMRKFFRELASGIAFIHSCGVAHRDLKPENLLIHTQPLGNNLSNGFDEGIVEDEKTLKIADFGLSAAFQLYPSPSTTLLKKNDLGNSGSTWDGSSTQAPHASSGLSPSPPTITSPKSGLSPLLQRATNTALSMLTCGSMTNVCLDGTNPCSDFFVDEEVVSSNVDLRRMTSVVGSPHYVAPEIIAQAGNGDSSEGAAQQQPQDKKTRHAARAGYDGTKADVWSAGVILYAMLFRSLPFGEDLFRCPRYQAFQKWYADARQLSPPFSSRRNRRAHPEATLDPNYDEFDEEEMLGPHWFFPSEITAPGRDLIIAMLNPDSLDRLTIEMVLQHPWLQAMDNYSVDQAQSGLSMRALCISGT